MYIAKNRTQIINETLNYLVSQTSIQNISPGSKARALVEALGLVAGNISQDISDGILQTFLTEATGISLDFIAESYGIQRLPARPARAEASDKIFRYYVRGTTFGDINNGNDIYIPAGTQIEATSGDPLSYFIQREDVVLPAADSEYYFAADQAGSIFSNSISPGSMIQHNFTGYTDSPFGSLLVTNEKGIAGRPRENDDNLRFRIRQSISTAAGANTAAIRLAALQVPGVSDIKVLNARAGLGTFDVVVFGIDPIVSNGVIRAVQTRVDSATAVGTKAIATAPRIVGVSINTSVKLVSGLTTGQKNAAINAARQAAREYIVGLNSGSSFVINSLVNTMISASNNIVSLGTPGKPFTQLLLWKSSTSENNNRFSRRLQTDYLIQDDEELVVEPFVANPITLTEAV